ncbi:MAG: AcrR family transcriptional regulator [Candidatus Azotimanducaceae bacterium]|jgi:AcrR family transcriptional regulator
MALKISTVDLNRSLVENDGVAPQNIAELNSNLRAMQKKTCKRETTRASLIAATKSLVLARGKEKISIQDITHRAQVGSGTFYNYFENKHKVFDAIAEEMLEDFLKELDEVRAPLKDPAMIVAVTLNHCFKRSQNHATWNSFLSSVGLSDKYVLIQKASQCFEDIKRGVAAGRFKVENISFTQNLILAMVRHINREIRLGNLHTDTIEDATRAILKMLGISDIIARALTQRPRPPIAAQKRKHEQLSAEDSNDVKKPQSPDALLRPISQKSRIIS